MRSLVVICCLTLLLSIPSTTRAQWYSDSLTHTPVAIAKWDQQHPQIISDGEGGAIIVWQDLRSSYNWDIYAQRISADGRRLWGNAGIAICTDYSNQHSPLICTDNAGGAYIVWEDMRNADLDIYAQHIDGHGEQSYGENGVAVGREIREQRNVTLVSNGFGRAILAWEDLRAPSSLTRPDIYLNILTRTGSRYGEGGYEAVAGASGQRAPALTADTRGGALLAWQNEYSPPVSIWASLIDSNGTLKWNPGGAAPGYQIFRASYYLNNASNVSITRDGEKFLLAWEVSGTSETIGQDIFANRVDRTGVLEWNPIEVTGEWPGNQTNPRIFSDDSNGMIVFFEDFTSDFSPKFYNKDLAAVRILADGFQRKPMYDDGFYSIVKQSRAQRYFQIEKDEDRYMLAWDDGRNGGADTSIYVQSVDYRLDRYFPSYKTNSTWGRVIANSENASHKHVAMTKREGGGYILAWTDDRSGDQDIYAQILFRNGTLPIELASFDVRTVGNDVLLDWSTANERDNAGFIVERRKADASSEFEEISGYQTDITLRGSGTSSNRKYYSYTDIPTAGKYEYRLTDVSLDGTQTRHPSRTIRVGSDDGATAISIYPNPATNGMFAIESDGRSVSRVEIRDMLGTVVRSMMQSGNAVDVHDLPPGVYAVSIYSTDRLLSTERLTILQ